MSRSAGFLLFSLVAVLAIAGALAAVFPTFSEAIATTGALVTAVAGLLAILQALFPSGKDDSGKSAAGSNAGLLLVLALIIGGVIVYSSFVAKQKANSPAQETAVAPQSDAPQTITATPNPQPPGPQSPPPQTAVPPARPQVAGYFSITDRLAPKQVTETIDVYIDGVLQGTLALDVTSGRTSGTLQVGATDHPVQYRLQGVETDTLEGGVAHERAVVGGGTIADPSAGRRYEFQPVRAWPFTVAAGEVGPTQIEEKIIASR